MSKDNPTTGVDANTLKSNEIARAVMGTGLRSEGLRIEFNNGTATVRGTVASEDDRRRVLDAVRGVGGVTNVSDSLEVGELKNAGPATPTGGGRTYTVKAGDTLSAIAKQHYGDASKYNKIFEANRNILSDPDKIQPGQELRIPD